MERGIDTVFDADPTLVDPSHGIRLSSGLLMITAAGFATESPGDGLPETLTVTCHGRATIEATYFHDSAVEKLRYERDMASMQATTMNNRYDAIALELANAKQENEFLRFTRGELDALMDDVRKSRRPAKKGRLARFFAWFRR